MWKKVTVVFGMSALLLVGCNNDEDLPETDETPMEDMSEDREMIPDDQNGTEVTPNGNGDVNREEDKDMMEDQNTPEEEIIEDDLDARDTNENDQ